MTPPRSFLTVHVLDTVSGRPAAGMRLDLRRVDGEALGSRHTNADGRCDTPVLEGEAMRAGAYAMTFHVAEWRAGQADPGFYDEITIRFLLPDQAGHVHLPLLLSPYGYSTYRGS